MTESIDFTEPGDALKAVAGWKRLKAYILIAEGESPKQVSPQVDLTRQGLQKYIDTWKENDLIYTDGNDYVLTEKGEDLYGVLDSYVKKFE